MILRVPSSKSYTNRALLIAALANGKSYISNALMSDDTMHMLKALKKLGVKLNVKKNRNNTDIIIRGSNGVFQKLKEALFTGNAGTAMRFLTAVLATQKFQSIITGNKRMRERPIQDLADALHKLGAFAEPILKNGCPPIRIKGPITGGSVKIPENISSQFISGLLMASPYAIRATRIEIAKNPVSKPYIDMTLSVMKNFGISVSKNKNGFLIRPRKYRAAKYEVEGDSSSASYFWGIAALTGRKITIENINTDSKQADMRFLNALKKMGCEITKEKKGIGVKGTPNLRALADISLSDMPDSALTVAALCAFAKGKSKLRGLAHLRFKECDRIRALAEELRKIGVKIKELDDGWEIRGNPNLGKIQKTPAKKIPPVETYEDHRIAMCFGMLLAKFPNLTIKNPECVSKSYPDFWKDLEKTLPTNIILTGMRGCGKTTLGKLLAKKLKRKFFDIDDMIVKKSKKNIPDIVAQKGWRQFRKLEKQTVKKLANVANAVIATGGGTFLDKKNTEILKENGKVILIYVPIAMLKKRLKKDKNRPSLTGEDPRKELHKLWKERRKRYEEAADAEIYLISENTGKNIRLLESFHKNPS